MTKITPITDSAHWSQKDGSFAVLYCNERNGVSLPPGAPTRVSTGVRIATDEGMAVVVSLTGNIDVLGMRLVSPMVIPPGHELDIVLTLHNHSSFVATIADGAPVALLVPIAAGQLVSQKKAATETDKEAIELPPSSKAEHRTDNPKVAGSSPAAVTKQRGGKA